MSDPTSPDLGTDKVPVADQPAQEKKSFWKSILPVMACGAGLFSDGYINNVRLPFP
jgi:hypothetical protein